MKKRDTENFKENFKVQARKPCQMEVGTDWVQMPRGFGLTYQRSKLVASISRGSTNPTLTLHQF